MVVRVPFKMEACLARARTALAVLVGVAIRCGRGSAKSAALTMAASSDDLPSGVGACGCRSQPRPQLPFVSPIRLELRRVAARPSGCFIFTWLPR
jgi:hypothetical protein